MRCNEILPLLEPFLDHECTPSEARLVASHLDCCSHCVDSVKSLQVENSFYLKTADRADVAPSLWENILRSTGSLSIREKTPRPSVSAVNFVHWLREWRLAPIPVFAILALAVGVTISVMKQAASQHAPDSRKPMDLADSRIQGPSATSVPGRSPQRTAETRPASNEPTTSGRNAIRSRNRESASDLVRDAEAKYLKAIAILQRDAVRHRAVLDDGTRTQLEQTLVDVDRAIVSTRKAVKQAPGDPVAVQYMLAAYSRKVDLLRQMVGE